MHAFEEWGDLHFVLYPDVSREEPAGIDSCSNLCVILEVITIPNFRLLSLIVFVLCNFEQPSLSDCDLICDYPVTAFWCL